MRLVLATVGLFGLFGCPTYDAPPTAELSAERGVFDPSSSELGFSFSEPINPGTLSFVVRKDRVGTEHDPCLPDAGGALPSGCTEPAATVVGSCAAHPAKAERTEDPTAGTSYRCDAGGSFLLSSDNSRVTITTESNLIPFERYAIEISSGLQDELGRESKVPTVLPFQVASAYPLAPTTFEEGMFFTVFKVEEPVAVEFDFYFWIEVKASTGEIRLFGSDIDPNSAEIDPKMNRTPADWHPDPNQPTGTTIDTRGQIVDGPNGRLLVAFPFTLAVAVPAVEGRGAELNALFSEGPFPGAPTPPEQRERADGRLFAPAVYLGLNDERAFAGEGKGTVEMFRLTDQERPALEDIMGTGMNADDIRNTFEGE